MKLTIKCSTGTKLDIEIESDRNVGDLKQMISNKTSVPASSQRLIFKGRVLVDAGKLEHYLINEGDSIHMVASGTQSATTPATTSATSASGLSPFGDDMDPDMMQSMMNSPMMQGLLDNPDIMRSMLLANPQMRDLVEANPHLNHVLNDPDLLRQSMSAARNPNVMQEMMRNQDRAMANIESLPGGYNALRRMYQDVQEPMMDAVEQKSAHEQGSTSTELNTGGIDPQNNPMPNPWGTAPSRNRNAHNSGSSFRMPSNSMLDLTSLIQPLRRANNEGPSLDGANPWAASTSENSPEVKYKSQLQNMENMGFSDKKVNIQALIRCNGNANEAIESIIEEQSK